MAQEIIIPQLGDSITTALIARWHRADGETVRKGECIVTLESDKVAPELEAEADGVLSIAVSEGEEVAIGTVIGSIAEGAVAPAPAVTTPEPVEEEAPVAKAPKPVAAPKPAQPSPQVDDDSPGLSKEDVSLTSQDRIASRQCPADCGNFDDL